jgi:hypothetical protein
VHSLLVLEIPKHDIKHTAAFETLGNDTLANKKLQQVQMHVT